MGVVLFPFSGVECAPISYFSFAWMVVGGGEVGARWG